MRLFSNIKKASEKSANKTHDYIEKNLLGVDDDIVSVSTQKKAGRPYVFIGTNTKNPKKIAEISKLMLDLQKEGKIAAVPIEIKYTGLAVACGISRPIVAC